MLFAGLELPPIPVLVSREFMERSGRSVGDVMEAMLETEDLILEIVDVIDYIVNWLMDINTIGRTQNINDIKFTTLWDWAINTIYQLCG